MILTVDDLSNIYGLFISGMAVGALLSGLPFIIGYAINAVIRIAQDSN